MRPVHRNIARPLLRTAGFIFLFNASLLAGLALLRQLFFYRERDSYIKKLAALQKELHTKNRALSEANKQLQALATTDPLTQLPNHGALIAALERELARAYRYRRPCTLCFIDLDHFKAINDGYGHRVGDTILCDFASLVRAHIREIDTLGRWGGEEFLAILPETSTDEAQVIAERVRTAVAGHAFTMGGGMRLTCSIGIATFPGDANDRDGLIAGADQAMYAAKRLGRNQVRVASDPAVLALWIDKEKAGTREEIALLGTVEALTALVEARDDYTGQHTYRVAMLTIQLALALGLGPSEAHMVGLAGRIQDIGKIGVPDSVLQKPARLSEEEYRHIFRHPVIGAEVVSRVPSLQALAPIIRGHHEHWDGSGYPDGLAGEEIPLGARILAVVDAYDAMITERHYQHAHDPAWALNELRRCAGTQFDPRVVEALAQVLAQDALEAGARR